MKKFLLIAFLAIGLCAAPISQTGQAGDIGVKVTTAKSLEIGASRFVIALVKDGKCLQ